MLLIISAIGAVMVFLTLWDTFETIIVPRTLMRAFRLSRPYYRLAWSLWRRAAVRGLHWGRVREIYLGAFGPLALLALIVLWAVLLIVGFALIYGGLQVPVQARQAEGGFATDLYLSGVTFYTLGFGDVTPTTAGPRALAVMEAGVGFTYLAVVVSYLPVLYGAFSRRGVSIAPLFARAGASPRRPDRAPSALAILRRYDAPEQAATLLALLEDWERWAAQLLESYRSYPLLAFYRSHQAEQSWLAALTIVLDTAAALSVEVQGAPAWRRGLRMQAQLTCEMAIVVATTLAGIVIRGDVLDKSCDEARFTPAEEHAIRAWLASRSAIDGDGGGDGDGSRDREGEQADLAMGEHRGSPATWAAVERGEGAATSARGRGWACPYDR